LLGFGPDDAAKLIATFRDIAAMDLGGLCRNKRNG
jgi:hypothetical protein